VAGRGVLAGYSAAEVHGASCGDLDAALVAAGWKVLRFDAGVVRNHPRQLAEHVRWEMSRRGKAA
jgi:very-short-patch-repair endonuclease